MYRNREDSTQSVIQSTLIKISFIIFAFIIILALVIGQNFWGKERLEIRSNLNSNASSLQAKIQSHITQIEALKSNHGNNTPYQFSKMVELVQADILGSKKFKLGIIGYYDHELGLLIDENGIQEDTSWINNPNASVLDYKINHVFEDAGKIILVKRPVYFGETLVGYALAYTNYSYVFFDSTRQVSLVLVLALMLSASVIYLIRKHFTQIRNSLEEFCSRIVNNQFGNHVVTRLPELNPVIDKITAYTENLKIINTELKNSKLKITKILEGISDGFFSLDRYWNFTFINEGAIKLLAKERELVLGNSIWDDCPYLKGTFFYEKVFVAMHENVPVHWEAESVSQSGRYFEYHAYPFDEGLTVIVRDITEWNHQKQELARLERLNLIAQLAAGISHEIRNPMTTVKGFLQLLGTKEHYTQDKGYISLMISEINRANGIITDFLSLAKVDLKNIRLQNINDVINQVYPMLQADAFNNNKEVLLELEKIPEVMINEGEIKQLILNLVRNGLEVTPEKGVVVIRTYETEGKIVLAIKDQGPGIPEEIKGKIGTPFFTTKDNGTGLGLSISIGIAHRHNATLDFESSDRGTTFLVTFQVNHLLIHG